MPKQLSIKVDQPSTVDVTVPDPVIKNTLSQDGLTLVTSFTQADPTYKITPNQATQPQVYKMPRLSGDIPNCGRSLCDFGTPSFTYKSKSVYDRYSWAQLQQVSGSINSSLLKSLFDKAKTNKQTVNFRIGMFDSGGTYGSTPINGFQCFYPGFVHTIMQAETIKDWDNGSIWFPNWNSPGMQQAWADFIALIVKWLKDNGYYQMLDFIDIGGYGDYQSEWHMYGFDALEISNKTKITDASQKFFIATSLKNFNDIPNIGNQALLDPRYASDAIALYALSVTNSYGLIGFRNDHIAWTTTIAGDKQRMNRVVNGINILDQYNQRYLNSPMIGEPMNNAGSVTPAGGTPYQTLINDVQDFGMVQFENKSVVTTAQAQTNFINAVNAIGTVGIDTVTIDVNGLAAAAYFKTGKAGLYWPWQVKFIADGVQLAGNVIPAVTKTLSVLLIDPSGYREPFFLSNTGRQVDGSYKVF